MHKYQVIGTFTGKTSRLSNDFESAITKKPQPLLKIKKDSIENDEVANTKYHGGEMRVIHHYSQENYNHLKNKFPDISHRFIPGSFGENILTEELSEAELNIGDIYQLGTAKVQLTVCRRPCATINYGYEDSRILKEVIASGRTGWFYRILEEGIVKVGDYLELLERPFPDMPLSKLHDQGYGPHKFSDFDFLKRCLQTELMDKGWKPKIETAFVKT